MPKTKGIIKQMAQFAPQGQHLLAQGSALGMEEGDVIAPCRGSIIKHVLKVLPLQADSVPSAKSFPKIIKFYFWE